MTVSPESLVARPLKKVNAFSKRDAVEREAEVFLDDVGLARAWMPCPNGKRVEGALREPSSVPQHRADRAHRQKRPAAPLARRLEMVQCMGQSCEAVEGR